MAWGTAMKSRGLLLLILLFAGTELASANATATDLNKAMDEIADRYAKCAAYFGIVSSASFGQNQDISQNYYQMAESALMLSNYFSGTTRSNEMSLEVTLANLQIFADDMMDQIGGDASNISILMAQHLRPCKALMNDPASVYQAELDAALPTATREEMLIEANRRGTLTDREQKLFDEAVRRGIIQIPYSPSEESKDPQ